MQDEILTKLLTLVEDLITECELDLKTAIADAVQDVDNSLRYVYVKAIKAKYAKAA